MEADDDQGEIFEMGDGTAELIMKNVKSKVYFRFNNKVEFGINTNYKYF